MATIEEVLRKAKAYNSKINEKRVLEAYHFAEKAHAGQTRMSGQSYISHPLAVADILTDYRADEESLIAALLHDVVEDTKFSKSELEKQFGPVVAKMVDSLTKLPRTFGQHPTRLQQFDFKIESLRKLFQVMQTDVRVIVIKLCDRLHNMQTLHHFRPEKQRRIAQETMDVFVKIADRLSIYDLKEKLERLCFRFLRPDQFEHLEQSIANNKEKLDRNRKRLIEKIEEQEEIHPVRDIIVRQLPPYERMMQVDYDNGDYQTEVFLILKNFKSCYLALQSIHSLWKNIRGSFKDYISLPKSNGYQALHTSILRGDGSSMTFIIQTPEMYDYGRYGVILNCFSQTKASKKIELPWVDNLKRIHQKTKEKSSDYFSALQNDILKGTIIIYTEDNKTLFLPPKSTALDAAFHYSGKKASQLSKVFINGNSRGYSTYLKDGDNVRFLFNDASSLQPSWLDKVNTSYSKSVISEIVNDMSQAKRLRFGHELLQKELNKRGCGYLEEIDSKSFKSILKSYSLKSVDELCLKVATGHISPAKACEILFSAKMLKKPSESMDYQLEMELLPGKYKALGSLFGLFEDRQLSLNNLSVNPQEKAGLRVKASVSFPRRMYDSFQKSLRGIYDVRIVELKETRRMILGKWLIGLFMVLVTLDPIVAYYLINEENIHYLDLLLFRFLTIFVVVGGILLVRKLRKSHVKESSIHYWQKDFILSAVAFFLTALFTYLSFDKQVTPFAYHFTIYVILFPFFSIYREKHSKLSMSLFLGGVAALYFGYIYYLTAFEGRDPVILVYALLTAIAFTTYTNYSTEFQSKQHIHRRYLSFFMTLSVFGAGLSLFPYLAQANLELPSLLHVGYISAFTIVFIILPYILYFIISGIYTYTSLVWKKFISILLFVLLGQWLVLGFQISIVEFAIASAFILGYWIFSRTLLPSKKGQLK